MNPTHAAAILADMPSGFFDFRQRMSEQAKPRRTSRRAAPTPGSAPDPTPGDSRAILSVAQLTAQLDRTVKQAFPTSLLVRGEISNYKHHGASGHAYFTLKDPEACVDCVMWKSDTARLTFTPEDGMELLLTARLAIYGQRGRYQLYVSRMEPLGQGALEIAFAQLKAKLLAEGLFEPQRKRPLPRYPLRIALVTSRAAAGLADILKVLRRYAFLQLWVYHVPVQGDGAAQRIADALIHLGQMHPSIGGIDVILLGRGGGSLEDLWAFNEEPVARAIAACSIPVVTGIGHQTDLSIADLVADHHAHTPTEAASVITAAWKAAPDDLQMLRTRARQSLRSLVQEHRQWLNACQRHELFRRPTDMVHLRQQRLDDRQRDLDRAIDQVLRRRRDALLAPQLRLERNRPSAIIARQRMRLDELQRQLGAAIHRRMRDSGRILTHHQTLLRDCHPRHRTQLAEQRLGAASRQLAAAAGVHLQRAASRVHALARHLNAVGPQQVLQRGYSITTLKKSGTLVRAADEVRPGDRLLTRFADSTVESVAEDPSQPGLFE